VGIVATGFCHPDGILQLFSTTRSTNFAAALSSSQIASTEFIANLSYRLHRQDLHRFVAKNRFMASSIDQASISVGGLEHAAYNISSAASVAGVVLQ
jgi:hypothetical protein